ncbi:nucleoside/nucleotide kinase family protein [Paramicrobacterium chengjingii]|uniref:Nucleoside/nucleotide kinase family protein n=1 Tax=Paramicrobacterium chengjingii TaxID=2769067 RepID=A0ABX6YGL1_9MICO|nr:nucleoside/nucleotide kinase family protein [Microbacterium chengjingii]QPZ37927.1 nucleoside/nucleotide kinase family protein [Microbacterium chengjingii]
MAEALSDLAAAARSIRTARNRIMLGVAGAPGAGKTTFARALVAELGADAAHVPMDGFHLADVTLDALGIRDRKGAPETFDRYGYARLLVALASRPPHTVYAPGFERDIEQPIAAALAIEPNIDVVVTEGNYLLLDGWRDARAGLDEIWFVREDETLRRERLIARHIAFGKTPDAARDWVATVDDANARLIEQSAARADRVIRLGNVSPVRSMGE